MSTRSQANSAKSSDLNLLIKSKNIRIILRELISKIVKEFNPDIIYLFGSYARGKYRKHSAIDILIIGETKLRFIERIKRILKLNKAALIINPLFYTRYEFEKMKKNNDGFMVSVMEEAVVLYTKEKKSIQ